MEMEGAKMLKAMVAITMAAMLFEIVSARNITVGGSTGWDLSTNLTQWSYSTPIFVNDSLLFIYTPAHDVIEVNEPAFLTCDKTSPIGASNNANGETLITLPQPGPRYFICGRLDHCTVSLKVRVQVLDRPLSQPSASSPNYPANQPDNRTNSDDPKELPPNSSDGQRTAEPWVFVQVILLLCLHDVIYGHGFMCAAFRLFYCILVGAYYNPTKSDDPKELPPNSSDAQRTAIPWVLAPPVFLLCLHDVTYGRGFVYAAFRLLYCILVVAYHHWFRSGY